MQSALPSYYFLGEDNILRFFFRWAQLQHYLNGLSDTWTWGKFESSGGIATGYEVLDGETFQIIGVVSVDLSGCP